MPATAQVVPKWIGRIFAKMWNCWIRAVQHGTWTGDKSGRREYEHSPRAFEDRSARSWSNMAGITWALFAKSSRDFVSKWKLKDKRKVKKRIKTEERSKRNSSHKDQDKRKTTYLNIERIRSMFLVLRVKDHKIHPLLIWSVVTRSSESSRMCHPPTK